MIYDREISGCFGDNDLLFANHPADQKRAFAWLTHLRERQARWAEVRDQVEAYLREQGASPFHILDQIDEVKRRFGPWLWGDSDEDDATFLDWCEKRTRNPQPDDGMVYIPLDAAHRLLELAGDRTASNRLRLRQPEGDALSGRPGEWSKLIARARAAI
jgi:hypothetical protein